MIRQASSKKAQFSHGFGISKSTDAVKQHPANSAGFTA
jgi:hypothetical protein